MLLFRKTNRFTANQEAGQRRTACTAFDLGFVKIAFLFTFKFFSNWTELFEENGATKISKLLNIERTGRAENYQLKNKLN